MKKILVILLMFFFIISCTKEEKNPTKVYSREIFFSNSFKSFVITSEKLSEFQFEKDIISFYHYYNWYKEGSSLKGGNE